MQQIMWETVFNKQFEEILDSYGIDKSDHEKIDSLHEKLNLTMRASCVLMVEVDENWKDKLIQILTNEKL